MVFMSRAIRSKERYKVKHATDLGITRLANFHPLSPFPASELAPEQSFSHPRSDTTLYPKALKEF